MLVAQYSADSSRAGHHGHIVRDDGSSAYRRAARLAGGTGAGAELFPAGMAYRAGYIATGRNTCPEPHLLWCLGFGILNACLFLVGIDPGVRHGWSVGFFSGGTARCFWARRPSRRGTPGRHPTDARFGHIDYLLAVACAQHSLGRTAGHVCTGNDRGNCKSLCP